ncbi:MAG: RNase adapter RapZ [Cellvibrionaceae bacterium]|nr:RNase adapter RapZ [Cellvibrionaceae bacterium]
MEFVVISGRSGSGKTTALQLLEDSGFICIDNLPVNLLPTLITEVSQAANSQTMKFAVGIDARTVSGDLSRFPEILEWAQQKQDARFTVVYLDASDQVLIKRFSETRRKHPLSNKTTGLREAIRAENAILDPVARLSDITIDTSNLTLHELRSAVKKKVAGAEGQGMALMFESFGFKYGVPVDADFVFDVRSLPNPYWQPDLRAHTGLQTPVMDFLAAQPQVTSMYEDIVQFLEKWIPSFEQNNRSYLTIAIGCTGGMHRSVYLADKLSTHFQGLYANVQTRHRQLTQTSP